MVAVMVKLHWRGGDCVGEGNYGQIVWGKNHRVLGWRCENLPQLKAENQVYAEGPAATGNNKISDSMVTSPPDPPLLTRHCFLYFPLGKRYDRFLMFSQSHLSFFQTVSVTDR